MGFRYIDDTLQEGVLQRHLTPHPKELKRQQQSEILQKHRMLAQNALEAANIAAEGKRMLPMRKYFCCCISEY